jgi:hypothetical protein
MLEGTPQLRKDPVYNSKNITILLFTILLVFKVKIQFVNEDSLIEQSPKSTVMNQVGNSKFPPSGHLIFFLPTYAMKIKPAKFNNGQERVIVPS